MVSWSKTRQSHLGRWELCSPLGKLNRRAHSIAPRKQPQVTWLPAVKLYLRKSETSSDSATGWRPSLWPPWETPIATNHLPLNLSLSHLLLFTNYLHYLPVTTWTTALYLQGQAFNKQRELGAGPQSTESIQTSHPSIAHHAFLVSSPNNHSEGSCLPSPSSTPSWPPQSFSTCSIWELSQTFCL